MYVRVRGGEEGGLCTEQDRLDLLKPAHQDRRENDSGRTVPEGPESYDSAAPQAATAGHLCQANWNSWSLPQKALVQSQAIVSLNVQIFRKVSLKSLLRMG